MPDSGISEDIKQFVFAHVDSVELIEVMMLMRERKSQKWTAEALSHEMRGNALSVANRLETLTRIGVVVKDENSEYLYQPQTTDLETLVDRLATAYKVRRHQILELIFSPMKRARNFADAFLLTGPGKKDEDSNG